VLIEMFNLMNKGMCDANINYLQQTVRVHYRRRRPRPLYLDDPYTEVYINSTFGEILFTTKSCKRLLGVAKLNKINESNDVNFRMTRSSN